jgi:hypothetical protein
MAVLTMETILHVIAIGFVFFGLAKDRLELEQRIAATTDPLTGVLNRRGFLSRAEAELAADREAGRPTALRMFDIDHFKRINDCWGHEAGDRALVASAASPRRSSAVRPSSAASAARNSPASSRAATRLGAPRGRAGAGRPAAAPTISVGHAPPRYRKRRVASTAAGRSDVSALMAAPTRRSTGEVAGRNRVEGSSRVPAEPRLRAA